MTRKIIISSIVIVFFCGGFGAEIPFDFDKEYRQEFSGIVIHHTGTKDNAGVKFLSDIHKTRIYKPVFDSMEDIVGKKIYSNHFYDKKETFCSYHWLVYPDGKKIKVLKDIFKDKDKWFIDNVAWNAGDWGTNGRTIAIAIVGNYLNKFPSKKALASTAKIIADYKKTTGIDPEILGHREVKPVHTSCPGNKFLGEKGWKKILLKEVEKIQRKAQ